MLVPLAIILELLEKCQKLDFMACLDSFLPQKNKETAIMHLIS